MTEGKSAPESEAIEGITLFFVVGATPTFPLIVGPAQRCNSRSHTFETDEGRPKTNCEHFRFGATAECGLSENAAKFIAQS